MNARLNATLVKAFGYQGDNLNLPVQDLDSALPFYKTVVGLRGGVACGRAASVGAADTRRCADPARREWWRPDAGRLCIPRAWAPGAIRTVPGERSAEGAVGVQHGEARRQGMEECSTSSRPTASATGLASSSKPRPNPDMAHLELVALIVREYDPAIRFFVDVLEFELVEDVPSLTNDGRPKRWVVVRPRGASTGILLARADGEHQRAAAGEQFAGRVGLFLRVDDFDATYARMVAAGVEFVKPPRAEAYGTVAVFRDLEGNRWDLLSRT